MSMGAPLYANVLAWIASDLKLNIQVLWKRRAHNVMAFDVADRKTYIRGSTPRGTKIKRFLLEFRAWQLMFRPIW
jgi:hypothetical protein